MYRNIQMVLGTLFLALFALSLLLTVMFFNSFTTLGIVSVLAASILCLGIGITAIRRNRGE